MNYVILIEIIILIIIYRIRDLLAKENNACTVKKEKDNPQFVNALIAEMLVRFLLRSCFLFYF